LVIATNWNGLIRDKTSRLTPDVLKFNKRIELFVCRHNETPSVAAVCIGDPDRSTTRING
jgi:hypothetical protein